MIVIVDTLVSDLTNYNSFQRMSPSSSNCTTRPCCLRHFTDTQEAMLKRLAEVAVMQPRKNFQVSCWHIAICRAIFSGLLTTNDRRQRITHPSRKPERLPMHHKTE